MNKLIMIIGSVAMLPFSTSAAWSSEYYTTTTNGITWKYTIDTGAKKIMLGKADATGDDRIFVDKTTSGVLYLPATLVHEDGVEYNVTDFGPAGLWSCASLTGVVIPETSFAQTGNAALFQGMTSLVAFWWKGSSTQATPSNTGRLYRYFYNNTSLRAVVFGPNVTQGTADQNGPILQGCSNVTVFIPKTWTLNDNYFKGTNCKVIRYGAGEDIDVSIDGTFTVATSNRLDDVLSVANYLHDYCGMNPKINVTNTIEVADVSITSEKLAYLDSGTFNSLVFKVNTQTQLDALLAAVPSTIPFAINPADAKETLTVPQGREVYVKLSAEGKQGRYTPKINGLIISFF